MSHPAIAPVVCYVEIDALLSKATRQSCQEAAKAFSAVDHCNVAVILCSGHTHGVLDYVTRALNLWHPFVVEDGCAICIPRDYFGRMEPGLGANALFEVLDFGRARRAVTETVSVVAARLGIELLTMTSMSPASIAESFGLSLSLATRARSRGYSEVVSLRQPSEFGLARLVRALRDAQLRCTIRGSSIFIVPEATGSRAIVDLGREFRRHFSGVRQIGLVHSSPSGLLGPSLERVVELRCERLTEVADAVARMATEIRQGHLESQHGMARPRI